LPVAAPVDVKAAETLARQSACMKCHAVDVKRQGLRGRMSLRSTWVLWRRGGPLPHVTTGRKARFDDGHEEIHPIVKTSDPDRINNLVNWILSLR